MGACWQRLPNTVAVTTTSGPAVEPVSLSDMKDYLRVDGTSEDDVITAMIKAARLKAEQYTGKRFITQTIKMVMDHFPYYDNTYYGSGTTYLMAGVPVSIGTTKPVILPHGPIQSITSVVTYKEDNTSATFAASEYFVDTVSGRLILNQGQTWPTELRTHSAVEITYVAGYGDAATDMPTDIIQAIKQIVQVMYETRETECSLPCGASMMLNMYREPAGRGYVDNGMQ